MQAPTGNHESHTTEETKDIPPIRASLTRLPKCTQHFLTWLTACALPGQKPLLPNSPGIQVAMSFLRLFLAIGLSMLMTDSMGHILTEIS